MWYVPHVVSSLFGAVTNRLNQLGKLTGKLDPRSLSHQSEIGLPMAEETGFEGRRRDERPLLLPFWSRDEELAAFVLQIKLRKNSEAPTGFEDMTSAIPVRCSTDWAMKPRRKQVRCEL